MTEDTNSYANAAYYDDQDNTYEYLKPVSKPIQTLQVPVVKNESFVTNRKFVQCLVLLVIICLVISMSTGVLTGVVICTTFADCTRYREQQDLGMCALIIYSYQFRLIVLFMSLL